jgi:hypothetical protein
MDVVCRSPFPSGHVGSRLEYQLDDFVVEALRRVTRRPWEIHMMIFNPDHFLVEFFEPGSDSFLVTRRPLRRAVTARGQRSGGRKLGFR